MKKTVITREMKRDLMTKFGAAVTFLVSVALVSTPSAAMASVAPRDANLNIGLAQRIVSQVYEETRAKHIVAGYEVAGPHDRIEHLCVDECACISKRFTKALLRSGYSTRTVLLKPAKNANEIRMRGAKPSYSFLKEASYDYHVVTAVRLLGGWRVVDPVATNGTTFVKFQDWQHLILTPVEMFVRTN